MEGIEEKAIPLAQRLLSKKSKWTGKNRWSEEETTEFVKSLGREERHPGFAFQYYCDPTGERGKYTPYIVNQLAKGNLIIEPDREEDAPRMLAALKFFHENSKKPGWNYPKDINQFKNWRQLEDIAEKESDKIFQSNRQQRKEISAGSKLVSEITVPNKEKTTYQLYMITEPETLVMMGTGTRWCTTGLSKQSGIGAHGPHGGRQTKDDQNAPYMHYGKNHPKEGTGRLLKFMKVGGYEGFPLTAARYLGMGWGKLDPARTQSYSARFTPIYIIFQKDGKNEHEEIEGIRVGQVGRSGQIAQLSEDGQECKDPTDREITIVSPALVYAAKQWLDENNLAIGRVILKRVRKENIDDIDNAINFVGFPNAPEISKGEILYLDDGGDDPYYQYHARPPRETKARAELTFGWDNWSVHYIKVPARNEHDEDWSGWILDDGQLLEDIYVDAAIEIAKSTGLILDVDDIIEELKDKQEKRRIYPSTPPDPITPDSYVFQDLIQHTRATELKTTDTFLTNFMNMLEELYE